MGLLDGLNEKQREAASHDEGPILVIAGAGTGKTRVLTHRIAYLLDSGKARPSEILAITFTNKAAKEMKERIAALIDYDVDRMWIGTFHSVCVRMLRKNIERLGYEKNFVIYDTDDQKTVIKNCVKELNLDAKAFAPNYVKEVISKAKNQRLSPEKFLTQNYSVQFNRNLGYVYELYEKKMKTCNALDFDDLLIKALELLEQNQDILEYYQDRFRYVLVDEYQDTNNIQYRLINKIGNKHDEVSNVFVVGDDDQSIYGWRGADIRNILDFERDFKGAKIVKLEKNYRSTNIILDTANAVIKNNFNRKGKELYTDFKNGELVSLQQCIDDRGEAFKVADIIKKEHEQNDINYGNIAVLYRMNRQSRSIEEGLMAYGIPYKIVGGLKFYGRKEIKDIVAYLMLAENPRDDVSFDRIINVPRRKIGPKALEELQKYASKNDVSLFEACYEAKNLDITPAGISSIEKFVEIMEMLMVKKDAIPVSEFVKAVYEETGYEAMMKEDNSIEGISRLENIQEFLSAAKDFEERASEVEIEDFLAHISLLSDTDKTEETTDERVTLLTVHSAKGLEYDVVFIVGMEEGTFPMVREDSTDDSLEEERRLFYVAVTRAKKRLYLMYASDRIIYGRHSRTAVSRFVEEIPENLLDKKLGKKSDYAKKEKDDDFGEYFGDAEFSTSFKPKKKPKKEYFTGGSYYIDDGLKVVDVYEDVKGMESELDYNVGDTVEHKSWGLGQIVSISGDGINQKATIDFETQGKKTVMLSYAPLKKI